jgi:hypothetical protein
MKKSLDELTGLHFDIFGFNQNDNAYVIFKKPSGKSVKLMIEGLICISMAPRSHTIVRYATVKDEYFLMKHQLHMARPEFVGQKFKEVFICFEDGNQANDFRFSDIVFLCTGISIQDHI